MRSIMRSLGSRESKTGESKQDSGSSFSKKSRGSASSKGGGDWNLKLSGNLQDMKMMETLGTGTFGRVRLILHKPSTNYYALKILKKSEVVRLKQVEHVLSERQILINISHPFIVNLVSAFQDNTKLYMLLEYVPGGEMFSHLRRRATFESDVARLYTAEIVLAFAHLHSMKIAYRDLKPENLLLTKEGHVKIADFGFAKHIKDYTWTLCGTPEYLAPEIIKSKGHGTGVDWWALGVLVYEMLAGYPPFYDESVFGIYKKILAGRVDFSSTFDLRGKDLVKKLLQADLSRRLGCLRNGAEDIKRQKWFQGLDWDAVERVEVKSKLVPKVRGGGDTSNFDKYPDSTERAVPVRPSVDKVFAEFDQAI